MELRILKCHGSGNDFVLIDEMDGPLLAEADRAAVARLLCDRGGPIGSDGILFAQPSTKADVTMRMFNPDGSEPQMCGNGLRCVARFAAERLGKTQLTVETMKCVTAAAADEDVLPGVKTYLVELGPFSLRASDLPLMIDTDTLIDGWLEPLSTEVRFTGVSAPNPHLIAMVDHIDIARLAEIGSRSAHLPAILPEKANVSFCRILDDREIAVATYERGVGLTLSCGSAMASSALTSCVLGRNKFDEWMTVFNRGGFVKACAHRTADGQFMVSVSGNATFVYTAAIDVDLAKGRVGQLKDVVQHEDEVIAYAAIQEAGEAMTNSAGTVAV